jgi:hypothetical protein
MCLGKKPSIPDPVVKPIQAPAKTAELVIGDTSKRKKKTKLGASQLAIPIGTGKAKSGLGIGGDNA